MLQGAFDKFYLNNHPDGKPPEIFVKGILLLYLGLLIQTLNNYLDGLNFSGILFFFVAVGFLIFVTGEGKKWARIILSVFILLNVFSLGYSLLYSFGILHINSSAKKSFEMPVYLIILTIVEIIIELWGWALMFTKQADWWFERKIS
ncbi:hypothetical protein MTO98_00020 [Mucilaginibacter sp. SMC90]|uniref:hypothetical protein n=1 Tax=Mucilaginibacter sp. SMC90 TaxID=2929803 RepID=UPI001FB2E712|nr:hypothetical protein [Mucilaginibacter sp. SMC90]UOE49456.1 hypothetical protein MTO98_00020 [Mucilaginibacter sp. SMC90]